MLTWIIQYFKTWLPNNPLSLWHQFTWLLCFNSQYPVSHFYVHYATVNTIPTLSCHLYNYIQKRAFFVL